MTWHVDTRLLTAYGEGGLTPSQVLAVDAHLQACAPCRGLVTADEQWLDHGWQSIADHLDRPGLLDRWDHRIRLLAATPALRWSWLAATAAVLTFAVLAAYTGQNGARMTLLLFLIFAPVLPVLAVATAYGPPADPMHEITTTTPMAGPALVLWRATAVVSIAMAMGAVAGALFPGPFSSAVVWLLPALLLGIGTLALATALPLVTAAAVIGSGWLLLVGGAAVAGSPVRPVFFGPSAQLCYLVAAALAGAVLTARRSRLAEGSSR
ncbi:zf-HC2 domain-containing protein [Actinoplanes sp. N902-109]|uniref:zf-HC2 domain-containing protein n=1 Tax=Actinoplanes sp. (strain N902-109) TaxID=649831 RepID=UPI0003294882|nr:zf-HC2 domain-containing protein [Actinoplanes sp. N902-109]AGL13538.1 integral membrane protein [Actinoplanes sp. N902-109]